MDLVPAHVVFSIVSAVVQMAVTILVLHCVVNLFSSKPKGTLNVVSFGLSYFFGSSIFLLIGASWLNDLNIEWSMFMGGSAFVEALLVHLFYGFLVAARDSGTVLSKSSSVTVWAKGRRTSGSRSLGKEST